MASRSGAAWRELFRAGHEVATTAGLAPGLAQANLVILRKELAYDFLLFCQRNPKPCPILEVTELGCYEAKETAPGSDLRTDLPKYRVYRYGELIDEPTDISKYWQNDFVSFLLGCSFTFESALQEAGIEVRHITMQRNVPMYITNRPCQTAGIMQGPLVVSMRPMLPSMVAKAVQVTSRYHAVHGAPVHIGDPLSLGIVDLSKPDMGEAVDVLPGEIPVFWACGCTPQAVIMRAKPQLVITHAPGHMFITDWQDRDLLTY
ncbi:MAG: putative hydro-lyase [Firmicutes bacterium]|nr:putative hydro-lyase [Dethiobacter sp.]MBS3887933.1 putative hydro-lyase [Bacillota bacterium]MBS4054227.1 putative hydro-lyase [Thermaerobacter sp.]